MRTLAIETATEACSIALFEGGELLAHDHRVLGRGHAEQLVPMIAALPKSGRAGRIVVSLGPGSFTGVRIGIAAARALGFAWDAQVAGYPTLALVAAQAREASPRAVTVCMNGGHGEWFVQNFAEDGTPQDDAQSLAPDEAARAAKHGTIAGNRAGELAELLSAHCVALEILPDARKACLVEGALLADRLSPIYGRGPDARLPGAVQP